MLKIKKEAMLVYCKYNLQFLFRNKKLAALYQAKKKVSSSITLRSPKHFNIGKHKILNLNYVTPTLIIKSISKININSLTNSPDLILEICSKKIQLNPTLSVKSIKVGVKTKFKLKWLVI